MRLRGVGGRVIAKFPDLVDELADYTTPHRLGPSEVLGGVQGGEPLIGESRWPVHIDEHTFGRGCRQAIPSRCVAGVFYDVPRHHVRVRPPRYEAMLAASGRPKGSLDGWWAETKLDGWRAITTVHDGRVSVRSRRDSDLTASVPELQCLAAVGRSVVLDGELVVGGGRLADFYRLSGRLNVRRPTAASARVSFMAFDLLWLDDEPKIGEPYVMRRALLEGLGIAGECGVIPRYPAEDLDALLAACAHEGMEGVVLKLDRSRYTPGVRAKEWAKVKCVGWAEHLERRRHEGSWT